MKEKVGRLAPPERRALRGERDESGRRKEEGGLARRRGPIAGWSLLWRLLIFGLM